MRSIPFLFIFLVPIAYIGTFYNPLIFGKVFALYLFFIIGLLLFNYKIFCTKDFKFPDVFRSQIFVGASLIFFIGLFVSFFHNFESSFFGTLDRGTGYFFYSILFLVGLCFVKFFEDENCFLQVAKAMFCIAVFMALVAVLQVLGLTWFFDNFDSNFLVGRAYSLLGNPTYLGGFLAMCIPLGFVFNLRSKLQNFLFIFSEILLLTGIIVSGTRSAILALLVVGFLYLIKLLKEQNKIHLKYIFILIGILLSFGLFGATRFNSTDYFLRSFESRLELWSNVLPLILKNFWGVGAEQLGFYSPFVVSAKLAELEGSILIMFDRLHNDFLSLVFSGGWISALVYLWLIKIVVVKLFSSNDKILCISLCSILIMVVNNQFSFFDPLSLFYFVIISSFIVAYDVRGFRLKFKFEFVDKLIFSVINLIFVGLISLFLIYFYNGLRDYDAFQKVGLDSVYGPIALYFAQANLPFYSQIGYDALNYDFDESKNVLQNIELLEGKTPKYLAEFAVRNNRVDIMQYLYSINPKNLIFIKILAEYYYRVGDLKNAKVFYDLLYFHLPYFLKNSQLSEFQINQKRIFLKTFTDFNVVKSRVEELSKMSL